MGRNGRMIFNSTQFFYFFVVVYALYLVTRKAPARLWVLLAANLVFYAWWDYRFLTLLLGTGAIGYVCAIRIHESGDEARRKRFLRLSLATNLGMLGFFKYFNFFVDSAERLLHSVGVEVSPVVLNIVLPVGISFYTFQTLSYTIDVYRRRVEPVRSFLLFTVYHSYFPQLVAGPIERAGRLLPQLRDGGTITWDGVRSGAFLALFGLYKKVVVADNLAPLVETVFRADAHSTGLEALLGVYAFALQIYGDFSGYTDIARGISRMMGIELQLNFRRPYFATNPRDFWARWHISLSEWLRDYLYVSLGGNRGGRLATYRNLAVTMILGGLWHGATWMFVLWGAFHGALLVVHRFLLETFGGAPKGPILGRAWGVVARVAMFHLACAGWIFFRAESLEVVRHVFEMLAGSYELTDEARKRLGQMALFATPLLAIDAWAELWERRTMRSADHEFLGSAWAPARGFVYAVLAFGLAVAAAPRGQDFIYFQF